MKLHLQDSPQEPRELAAWLDSQVAGPHLGELAQELAALAGSEGKTGLTLDEVLGTDLAPVLSGGLATLSAEKLRELLRRPRLLLELQERVLSAGAPYWDAQLGRSPELARAGVRSRRRFQRHLASVARARQPLRVKLRPVFVLAAAAVVTIAAVIGWETLLRRPDPGVWGWLRPGVLTANVSAPQYFLGLAAAAEEWDKQQRESTQDLARRLLELRAGCSALIAAPHVALADADRAWLRERCRAWAADVDKLVLELDGGAAAPEVSARADALVSRLAGVLRDRARQV
jgi:hypothetical protein